MMQYEKMDANETELKSFQFNNSVIRPSSSEEGSSELPCNNSASSDDESSIELESERNSNEFDGDDVDFNNLKTDPRMPDPVPVPSVKKVRVLLEDNESEEEVGEYLNRSRDEEGESYWTWLKRSLWNGRQKTYRYVAVENKPKWVPARPPSPLPQRYRRKQECRISSTINNNNNNNNNDNKPFVEKLNITSRPTMTQKQNKEMRRTEVVAKNNVVNRTRVKVITKTKTKTKIRYVYLHKARSSSKCCACCYICSKAYRSQRNY